jgi:transcriptional regulator with XRE-family HTH domain
MYIKKLKEFRENNNLTQKDVAEELKITQQQYCLYEIGKRDLPINHLITLAEFYKTTTDNILGIK